MSELPVVVYALLRYEATTRAYADLLFESFGSLRTTLYLLLLCGIIQEILLTNL